MAERAQSAEDWTAQLQAADRGHLNKIRELRRRIQADESLEPLTRAVLGATGSVEELERYRALAKKIGESAGQPLIMIYNKDRRSDQTKDSVTKAAAGIITGPLRTGGVHFGPSGAVHLEVPVSPQFIYTDYIHTPGYNPQRHRHVKEVRDGSEALTVAAFYLAEARNETGHPSGDFSHGKGSSLVGFREIEVDPLYHQGLSQIVSALVAPGSMF